MTSPKLLVALVAAVPPCLPSASPPARRSGSLSATAAWKQVGKGDFNPGDATAHHQSGRSAQTAWAFDAHQGREVLWNGTSHGGLWKSIVDSSGAVVRWEPLTDNFPGSHTLGSFLLQRFDSDKILISTGTTWGDGNGVYRSTDGGATWSGNTLPVSPKQGWRLAEDRSDPTGDTVFAGTSMGILRSHDFGATWDRPLAGENITDLVQDAAGPSRWYAGDQGTGVIYSSDGGSTWCTLGSGLGGTLRRISLAQSKADAKFLYALAINNDGSMQGLFRHGALDSLAACDGAAHGGAWTDITGTATNTALDALNQGGHTAGLAADPADPDHLIFGLQDPAETHDARSPSPSWNISVDGGHHDYNFFDFLPDGRTVVTSNDGGYYLYDFVAGTLDDTGNLLGIDAFEPSSNDVTGQGALSSSWSDPDLFLGGCQDNGIILGDLSADPAQVRVSGGDGGHVSFMPANPAVLAFSTTILEGQPGHRFLSSDSGATADTLDCGLGGSTRATVLIDPTPGLSAPMLFTDTQDTSGSNSVVYFKDLTTTCNWQLVGSHVVPGIITRIDHTTNPSRHVIVAAVKGDAHVYRYSGARGDLGSLSFDKLTLPLASVPSSPDVRVSADKSSLQPDTLYYVSGKGRPSSAWVSFDAGDTWTEVTGDIDPSLDLNKLVAQPKDPTQLFLATSNGVYRSGDNGQHWQAYSDGLRLREEVDDLALDSDSVDPPSLIAATNGRGFWSRSVNQIPAIACPAAQTVECSSPSGTPATVTVHVDDAEKDALAVTLAIDGADAATSSVAAGAAPQDVGFTELYAKGVHHLKATVSDGQGEASCTTRVTIVDTTPPVVTCSLQQAMLWPPNSDLINVGLASAAVDACDGPLPVALGVTSDEDDQHPGTGPDFSPDAKDIAPGTLRLRAERAGGGDGRVYLVAATADDSSGNAGAACCTAVVPKSQGPEWLASMAAQATAAVARCPAAPAGFVVVGDGPVVGPKQ